MTQTQTRQIVDTLSAWISGSVLADDLVPQTEALIASLLSKPVKAPTCQAIDTNAMSTAQLFAYYKRTAPAADVRFHLQRTLPADVRARYEALLVVLEAGKPNADTKREYLALQQAERQTELGAWRMVNAVHAEAEAMLDAETLTTDESEAA